MALIDEQNEKLKQLRIEREKEKRETKAQFADIYKELGQQNTKFGKTAVRDERDKEAKAEGKGNEHQQFQGYQNNADLEFSVRTEQEYKQYHKLAEKKNQDKTEQQVQSEQQKQTHSKTEQHVQDESVQVITNLVPPSPVPKIYLYDSVPLFHLCDSADARDKTKSNPEAALKKLEEIREEKKQEQIDKMKSILRS